MVKVRVAHVAAAAATAVVEVVLEVASCRTAWGRSCLLVA